MLTAIEGEKGKTATVQCNQIRTPKQQNELPKYTLAPMQLTCLLKIVKLECCGKSLILIWPLMTSHYLSILLTVHTKYIQATQWISGPAHIVRSDACIVTIAELLRIIVELLRFCSFYYIQNSARQKHVTKHAINNIKLVKLITLNFAEIVRELLFNPILTVVQ